MIGYEMMSGAGMFGMSLFGLVYLAIATFVVSSIFWWTHNWIVNGKK